VTGLEPRSGQPSSDTSICAWGVADVSPDSLPAVLSAPPLSTVVAIRLGPVASVSRVQKCRAGPALRSATRESMSHIPLGSGSYWKVSGSEPPRLASRSAAIKRAERDLYVCLRLLARSEQVRAMTRVTYASGLVLNCVGCGFEEAAAAIAAGAGATEAPPDRSRIREAQGCVWDGPGCCRPDGGDAMTPDEHATKRSIY
jgi:hypothetical protein